MAEEIVSVGVGELLKTLCILVAEQISPYWGVEGSLKKLQTTLTNIQAVLQDAERRQAKDQAVRHWLKRLKGVAYDADDVLGEFSYEDLRRKLEIQNRLKNKVRYFFSPSNPFAFRFKMAHKIKDINKKFDEIVCDMGEFQLIKGVVTTDHHQVAHEHRETHSYIDHSEVVGREDEKSKLVTLLTNSGEQESVLSIVPIVGMGGLGKTTLAKLVFNDKQVEEYFKDLRKWVYVSEDFDVKKVAGAIAESADDSRLETIACRLQEKLRGKRFLLVLDDVWNENREKWNSLRDLLLCGAKGSKALVTTRKNEVASFMGTLPTHQLHTLTEDESWSLFQRVAFGTGECEEEISHLVEIGKGIVNKCGGLPLAIKTLGGLLRNKREEKDWQGILKNEIWNLDEKDNRNQILPALKLSYDYLPSYLKHCFTFCSIFPKGEYIEIEKLIRLWMAEGLLQPPENESILMEDVGYQYVNMLLSSSFFQDVERNTRGDIEYCQMHDLVYDLAQSVSGSECSVLDANKIGKIDETRSLTVVCYENRSVIPEALCAAKNLRVLIMFRREIENVSGLMSLKCLRVLDLSDLHIKKLPQSIVKLKHLRYLDLSWNPIEVLPTGITLLYNLQTLNLNGCDVLKQLPSNITKLVNLRHFEFEWCKLELKEMPMEMGRLTSLQTLPLYLVGRRDRGCGISELKCLDHLTGELEIKRLENVKDREDAKSACLKKKQYIRELALTWSRVENEQNNNNDDEVLEGLQPHSKLKGLKIWGFNGARLPTWLAHTFLPSLMKLELWNLSRCEHLPAALGLFRHLRYLRIHSLENLKEWATDEPMPSSSSSWSSFPELEELYIENCPSLTSMPTLFPRLRYLRIHSLENLKEWATDAPMSSSSSSSWSSFPVLEILNILNCPSLTSMPTLFPRLRCLGIHSLKILKEWAPNAPMSSSFPVLEELDIEDCPSLTNMRTQFPSLKKLRVSNCNSMVVVKLGTVSKLTSLTSLEIKGISDLTDLPEGLLRNNNLLQSLTILNCYKLKCFLKKELRCLTSLEDLTIGGFSEEFDSFPALEDDDGDDEQRFVPLRYLYLIDWPNLTSLPDGIQRFTALRTLKVSKFPNLVALPEWLRNFSSLETLRIHYCERLMHMPSAEAVRSLTTLQRLVISHCPSMKERCAKEGGEEWHKISHIPTIISDSYLVQDLSSACQI